MLSGGQAGGGVKAPAQRFPVLAPGGGPCFGLLAGLGDPVGDGRQEASCPGDSDQGVQIAQGITDLPPPHHAGMLVQNQLAQFGGELSEPGSGHRLFGGQQSAGEDQGGSASALSSRLLPQQPLSVVSGAAMGNPGEGAGGGLVLTS